MCFEIALEKVWLIVIPPNLERTSSRKGKFELVICYLFCIITKA